MGTYKQKYITVHDFVTPQDKFESESMDGNGLAILIPTICRITEELNGTYELYMEHPFDEEGRWKYLEVDNIIKADGQLFRIKNRRTKLTADGRKVRAVDCLHIWYDLAGRTIPSYSANCKAYWFVKNLHDLLQEYYVWSGGWFEEYTFIGQDKYGRERFTTDCGNAEPDAPVAQAYIEPVNMVSAVIGTESSFVSIYEKVVNEETGEVVNPELYRDNFHWSLQWRRENARDNAFSIMHKIDMIDVEELYDTSDYYTHVHAYDNFGNFKGENIKLGLGNHVPKQPRIKQIKFQYSANEFNNDKEIEERFHQDFWRYFRSITAPKITIKCNYAELSDTDLYKDFIAAKHCNVGDSGTIFCEDIGIAQTMKVIRKTWDLVDKSKVEITFGSKLASITSPKFMSQTINNSKFENLQIFSIVD